MVVAVLGCAAAAGLALLAAGRTWATVTVTRPAPLPAAVEGRTGGQLAPWLPALAAVALAAAGALVATRGASRVAVGVVLIGCGAGVAASGAGLAGVDPSGAGAGWAALSLACGVTVAAVGVLAIRSAGRWPSLGARFGPRPVAGPSLPAPAAGNPVGDASPAPGSERAGSERAGSPGGGSVALGSAAIWAALDRGEDPTAEPGHAAESPGHPAEPGESAASS